METYKDVIVSHPPAMYSQSGYTTHFALENYKGILLCQRPSNLGSAAGLGGAGGGNGYDQGNSSSVPFVPSKPSGNPLGYGPSKESRDARAEQEALRVANQRQRQTKSSQTLSRHRRWLRSFARQVKSMKESDRQLEVEAAQRAARVREAEKRKRAEQQQQQQHELATIAVSTVNASAPPYNMHKSMEAHVAATLKGTAVAVAPSSRKPKWALTEEEAMDAELDFDRDLLDFAENLDYEKFISDFEVAEALGVMRDRVEEIARANNWSVEDIRRAATDDDDDLNSVVSPSEAHLILGRKQQQQGGGAAAAEARAALPEALAVHAHDWDSSSSGRGRLLKKAISRDALALAERLFAASPSLQKVHTRHTLARALQRCALEGHVDVTGATFLQHASKSRAAKGGVGVNRDAASPSPAAVDPPAIPEPLVVKMDADAMPAPYSSADGVTGGSAADIQPSRILRELQQSKERTQGLPYLYRCPAI
ncbi:conserved hypothetical protein [Leishmania mexicana MHOM/GT/2001/U1103]|uniref:Uncharacterized protein n=1 Tax=Leishmania mexicana (strain MHOM/GT/2001/U1103) TaxID=929439 RepID=E9AQ27_LEIMU|nr:conserved hypothetical protein [Leishmania mexicana MHOM/GT/2001/U1103]CBZ25045.1 conserved hypothetical protein [Leishmania mexicana MHOM/GT/2001/U1103]